MDNDLENMTYDELIAEVKKLREGIRKHRDSSGHNLCWFHPDLWNLLPEKYETKIEVPDWPQFMEGCVRYRKSLDEQNPNTLEQMKLLDK
ncbi:hypothetical protein SAMN05216331_10198 [Porphyromonadaceae bacterium KH3R12]|nr:hypothetical protein SAMN05216331_10198 [Porphyromonadaceae bacterium KH3R12]